MKMLTTVHVASVAPHFVDHGSPIVANIMSTIKNGNNHQTKTAIFPGKIVVRVLSLISTVTAKYKIYTVVSLNVCFSY